MKIDASITNCALFIVNLLFYEFPRAFGLRGSTLIPVSIELFPEISCYPVRQQFINQLCQIAGSSLLTGLALTARPG